MVETFRSIVSDLTTADAVIKCGPEPGFAQRMTQWLDAHRYDRARGHQREIALLSRDQLGTIVR